MCTIKQLSKQGNSGWEVILIGDQLIKQHVFVQMVLNNLQFHRKKFSTALLTKGTLRINFSNNKLEIKHPDTAERRV